jgi:MFS family permease
MAWQIYELTDSAAQIGILGLARAGPQMGLLLFGGLLADTFDRRRLLVFTTLAQLAVSSSLFALTLAHAVTPPILFVASALLALFTALGGPSRQSFMPALVPRPHLGNAIALNNAQRNVGQIAGPSLAGVLLTASGAEWCYFVDAFSWLALLASILAVNVRRESGAGLRGLGLDALREGFRYSFSQPLLLSLIALDFGANFFGSPRALLPVYARDVFHVGANGLGLMYAASSIGAVVAGVFLSMIGHPRRTGLFVLLALGFYAVSIIAFALSPAFVVAVIMLACMGAGDTINAVLRTTIVQLVTPDALRGRVSSLNSVFTGGGPQLGQFESGLVAEWWGAQASALTGGIATLLIVLGVAAVPAVRRFEPERTVGGTVSAGKGERTG